MNKNINYSAETINALESSISIDRLSTYLKYIDNDKEKALNLYLWNSKVSSAFYPILQVLEIALRNALHDALTNHFQRPDWYEIAPLDGFGQKSINDAIRKLAKSNKLVTPSRIVAELSFGFWVSLLAKRYQQSLWQTALWTAFPNKRLSRPATYRIFDDIKSLRNRIFHYEPIFNYNLKIKYNEIIEALERLNKGKADLIKSNFSIEILLNEKP